MGKKLINFRQPLPFPGKFWISYWPTNALWNLGHTAFIKARYGVLIVVLCSIEVLLGWLVLVNRILH